MKNKILLFMFFLVTLVSAQHNFLKMPKLEQEEVKNTKPTSGEDIPAEILYRSMYYRIEDNGNILKTYRDRVKIYNKDQAKNFLDKEIYVIETDRGARQTLSGLKAYTYNFENGQIVPTKVEKDSKYKSKEDKNVTVTKFAFPNVKNGSVLEYEYELTSPSDFLISVPKFVVEDEVPIRYVEYIFDAPEVLGYNLNYTGTLTPKYRDVSKKNLYGSTYNVYRFGYENIPAFKDEDHVLNNDNYKTSIKNELNSTVFNHEFKSYAMNWKDIQKRLMDSDDFGGQLNKKNLVKNILPEDISSIRNQRDKATAILKYVQKNYTWNKENDIAVDEGIKNLINTKVGNVAEINLFLTMLLRETGLNANPVILSTIDRGLLMSFSPSIAIPNYVISVVEIDGKLLMLDATSKFSSINTIPPRALNYNGIMMTDKEATVLNIVYPEISKTYLTVEAIMKPDGTFDGTFSDKDTKLFSLMANEFYQEDKTKYSENYKEQYKFPISNMKSGALNDDEFETTMNFTSDTFVDNLGSKLAFNPLLFLYTQNHSFNQKEPRIAPIELLTGYERIKKVNITLPEGFVFDNVPNSKKFRTDDNSIVYSYVVTKSAPNKLTVETSTLIADSVFPKEYYPAFKQIFDNITKLEGQVVTAVKK